MSHRFRTPLGAALLAGLAGCGGGAPAEPKTEVAIVPHIRPELPPVTTPTAQAPKTEPIAAQSPQTPTPAPSPTPTPNGGASFEFPKDAGGKKLAAMLAAPAPAAPELPGTKGPKVRSSALDRGELPLPSYTSGTPMLPLPKATTPRPTPPGEGVPVALGQTAAEDPSQVKLPNPPTIRTPPRVALGAAELHLLATPLPSRAPLTDPTVDLSALRVVVTEMPVPALAGWFLKFGVPDPFELIAHLRSKTALDTELATTPSIVPPSAGK